MITVPILIGFNVDEVIGSLTVDETKLPPTPNFSFTLAYSTYNPTDRRDYILEAVSPVDDLIYLKYLEGENSILI